VELVFAFALVLGAVLLITVATTGSTFGTAIRGKADTSKLKTLPGA
jgi:hypothetical protein